MAGAAIKTVEESATSAAQPAGEKKPGSRRKTCPGCQASLPFPTRRCPQCGHPFGKQAEVKAPAARKGTAKSQDSGKGGDPASILRAANDFTKQVGGLDQAISLLEAIKEITG